MWILRYAQYDKQTLLLWLAFCHSALTLAAAKCVRRRKTAAFACRKRLIANSVLNLPFVCQANSNTIKIIAQKISFAEKICKFFQAHAQNKAKKVPQITENAGWGGRFCVFVKFWKNF